MRPEPLEHGQPWHEAGRRCDQLISETGRIGKLFEELDEEALVAIGHARYIQRRINQLAEGAPAA